MPPKTQKGGAHKQKPKEEQREDALQAVVLADSFERRFTPFSLERPRCLLPLANAPLIEYTLEFLAHAGVEEIFVYCGAHTEQVEDYLNSSRWKSASSPFRSLQLVRSPATSVGDAMRDLDNRGYITGDFVLVAGDVVSNIAIEPALARHRARREKDKNAIMTMILREAGNEHRSKASRRKPVFIIDPQTDRCIRYEEISQRRGPALELDPELLSEHPEIDIRSDLFDCYIDICTPDVLSLWSDNFDFQEVRGSFLRGVLKDYELNGKTFHTHIVKSGYAARVRSLRSYDTVSRDIISRWTYPFTPDCNVFAGQKYRLGKNKTYIEDGVSLARGSSVQRRSIVGRHTSVGINSVITDSIIGRGCHIGNNVRITGAYVWDDVTIGDNSVVERAMIGEEVSIGRNCIITPGSLLSSSVRLADNISLPEKTRLTLSNPEGTRSSSAALPLVGSAGAGYEYHSPSSSASSSPAASPLLGATRRTSIASLSSISTIHSRDESASLTSSRRPSAADQDRRNIDLPVGASPDSAILIGDHSFGGGPSAAQRTKLRRDFVSDATASVYDGMLAHEPPDKIRLELVAMRLSSDATDAAVRDALVSAFMKRTWALVDGTDPSGAAESGSTSTAKLTPANAVKAVWAENAYGWLLAQMGLFDIGATSSLTPGSPTKPDQVAVLRAVERSCASPSVRQGGREVLFFVVVEGAQGGWLQDVGIQEWWEGVGAPAGEPKGDEPAVRQVVKKYVEDYVLGGEEDSSEEEEDDDDDDDDDDEDESEEESD